MISEISHLNYSFGRMLPLFFNSNICLIYSVKYSSECGNIQNLKKSCSSGNSEVYTDRYNLILYILAQKICGYKENQSEC